MAPLRRAPADQVLPLDFVQKSIETGSLVPLGVLRDHLVTGSVPPDFEGIAPAASATDVDGSFRYAVEPFVENGENAFRGFD